MSTIAEAQADKKTLEEDIKFLVDRYYTKHNVYCSISVEPVFMEKADKTLFFSGSQVKTEVRL